MTAGMSEAECFAKSNGVVVDAVFENKKDLEDFASKIKIGDVVSFYFALRVYLYFVFIFILHI